MPPYCRLRVNLIARIVGDSLFQSGQQAFEVGNLVI